MPTETAAPVSPDTARTSPWAGRSKEILGQNGALGALVVLTIVMAILSPVFLSPQNLVNVGTQAAVVAILAFGQTFVIVSAGIDLSVGSVAALSAIVTGYGASTLGLPPWIAILLGLGAGFAAGVVNGVLISYGRLPAFIATMAMLSVARGLALVISNGVPVKQPAEVAFFGSTLGGWLPVPLLVMLALGVLAAFILNRTYVGRCMYAIGGNEEAARLSGIDVGRQKLIIYALSSGFAAVAASSRST